MRGIVIALTVLPLVAYAWSGDWSEDLYGKEEPLNPATVSAPDLTILAGEDAQTEVLTPVGIMDEDAFAERTTADNPPVFADPFLSGLDSLIPDISPAAGPSGPGAVPQGSQSSPAEAREPSPGY